MQSVHHSVLLKSKTPLDNILEQVSRSLAIHAVLVLVGRLTWTAVVRSQLELIEGPLHTLITVAFPQVGVELNALPEHQLACRCDLIGERQRFLAGQTVCFLSHDAWAVAWVDGVGVPGHHDGWDPLAALALFVFLVEVLLGEGVTELLDDALEGLADTEVADLDARVHALLQAQHFREQGIQWRSEAFSANDIPRFFVTDTDEGDTAMVDLVVLLLQPVEATVTLSILELVPVLLATTLVLEELDGLTLSLLVGVLFVLVVRLFPSLGGVSQVLLEEQVVGCAVGDSILLVHVGVAEVELGVEVDAAQILVGAESTGHRSNGLTSVTSEEEDGGSFLVVLHAGVEGVVDGVVQFFTFGTSIEHVVLFGQVDVGFREVHHVLVSVTEEVTAVRLPFLVGSNEGGFVGSVEALYMHIVDTLSALSVCDCEHISVEWESVSDHPFWKGIAKVEVSSHLDVVSK